MPPALISGSVFRITAMLFSRGKTRIGHRDPLADRTGPGDCHGTGIGPLHALKTGNAAVFNDSQIIDDIDITILQNGEADSVPGSERGIALIRRLAADDAGIACAEAARRDGDICEETDLV